MKVHVNKQYLFYRPPLPQTTHTETGLTGAGQQKAGGMFGVGEVADGAVVVDPVPDASLDAHVAG